MYNKALLKVISLTVLIVAIIGFIKLAGLYTKAFRPNISVNNDQKSTLIHIPSEATIDSVFQLLYAKDLVENRKSFEWVAYKKNYDRHVKPGMYLIKDKMSNNELINILRGGIQEPVMVTFNNIRTKKELAATISQNIEAEYDELLKLLNNKEFLAQFNLNVDNVNCIFIPNTYEFYWNTSAEEFVHRMYKEYERFWDNSRREAAEKTGLTPIEVSILASIVDEETLKKDEKPKIAGVYINRLNKGIRLQADPTVRFALGNFSVKRIINSHLTIDSPYNTYKYAGLPPGPIALPSISGIDAVLNYEKHKYLYFCAKDDFSGYHNFAKTLEQHNRNAYKYRRALNKRRIYR